MDFPFFISRLVLRWHWIAVFCVIGVTSAAVMTSLRTPVYVALARILVEPEQISSDLAGSSAPLQSQSRLDLILQRILVRDSLSDLAWHEKIYEGLRRNTPLTDEQVSDLRSRIRMTHAPGRDAVPLISISFEASSSQLAADVANKIATMVMQEDVATRTQIARKTLEFYTQEVTRLERELAAQDAAILAFRQENTDSLPDSLAFRRTQQTTLQERLLQVERQIGTLREFRAKSERRRQLLAAADAIKPSISQSNEEIQLAVLEEDLATQTTLLSPDNPRVKILLSQVNGLRQRLQAAGKTPDHPVPLPEPASSYEIERAEIEGDLAELTTRKTQISDSLTALAESIEATTSNGITLGNLERTQANTRAQHEQAVASKTRAETSKMIETLRHGQHISLFEKALPPLHPKGPSRLVALVAGFLCGLLGGVGFVFIQEHFSKKIRRAADISNALGIIPFATLPYQTAGTEISRRRTPTQVTVALVLAGLSAGLWALQGYSVGASHVDGTIGPTELTTAKLTTENLQTTGSERH